MVAQITPESRQETMRPTAGWTLDPDQAEVSFAVGLCGIATVRGRFHRASGTLAGDRIDLRVDAASIDTGNSMRDRHLRGRDVLDASRHRWITFASTSLLPLDAVTYRVTGELTIRGHTRPHTLTVACDEPVATAGERRRFVVEMALSRKDFGVGPGVLNFGFLVADTVHVQVRGELVAG